MIIQCEQCMTKFRLDDSKVTDKGVKVRCTKCRHVFSVSKEQQESLSQKDFGTLLDESVTSGSQEVPPPSASFTAPASPAGPSVDSSPFDTAAFDQEEFSEAALRKDADPFETNPEERFPPPAGYDFSASSLEPGQPATEQEEFYPPGGDFDFESFTFGDVAGDTNKITTAFEPTQEVDAKTGARPEADDNNFDFGEENLFGDAVAVPAAEEPATAINFDFQTDQLEDQKDVETSAREKEGVAESDKTFEPDEINLGDQARSEAVQQDKIKELMSGRDMLSAPFAEALEKPAPAATAAPPEPALQTAPATEEELPPLSIPSRRKQSPMLLAFGLLGIMVLAVIGFFSFSMMEDGKGKAVPEADRITVRSVDAAFVNNKEIGDLLVISGEAVNEYKKPRAAIQVKGIVYGSSGQVLTSKNGYAGNPLSKEQLATLPMEKIEAAMANQFGDSLANLEVAPGKAIPFTIVIAKPPAEAKDYGVEPTGSTVATGKQ